MYTCKHRNQVTLIYTVRNNIEEIQRRAITLKPRHFLASVKHSEASNALCKQLSASVTRRNPGNFAINSSLGLRKHSSVLPFNEILTSFKRVPTCHT